MDGTSHADQLGFVNDMGKLTPVRAGEQIILSTGAGTLKSVPVKGLTLPMLYGSYKLRSWGGPILHVDVQEKSELMLDHRRALYSTTDAFTDSLGQPTTAGRVMGLSNMLAENAVDGAAFTAASYYLGVEKATKLAVSIEVAHSYLLAWHRTMDKLEARHGANLLRLREFQSEYERFKALGLKDETAMHSARDAIAKRAAGRAQAITILKAGGKAALAALTGGTASSITVEILQNMSIDQLIEVASEHIIAAVDGESIEEVETEERNQQAPDEQAKQ